MASLLRSVGLLCARLHAGPVRSYATNYKPKDRQQFADALNKLSSKDMILVSQLSLQLDECLANLCGSQFSSAKIGE